MENALITREEFNKALEVVQNYVSQQRELIRTGEFVLENFISPEIKLKDLNTSHRLINSMVGIVYAYDDGNSSFLNSKENVLKNMTLLEFVKKHSVKMCFAYRNFGQKSYNELEDLCKKAGITWR